MKVVGFVVCANEQFVLLWTVGQRPRAHNLIVFSQDGGHLAAVDLHMHNIVVDVATHQQLPIPN